MEADNQIVVASNLIISERDKSHLKTGKDSNIVQFTVAHLTESE